MASTVIRGAQIKDSTVQRHDLDTSTVGQAVVTKIVQGSGVTLSSTGADSGTGDVTVAASAIPLASSAQSGLLNQTSGNTTDFIDGTNNSQPLQPVIWSVRLRSFNAVGNPTFEVDQRSCGTAVANPQQMVVDRWNVGFNASSAMRMTAQQVTATNANLPGTSFLISRSVLRITLNTQQTTLASGDYLQIYESVEGPMLRELLNDVHSVSLLVRCSSPLKFSFKLGGGSTTYTLVSLCTISTPNVFTLIPIPNLPIFPSAAGFNINPGNSGYNFQISLAMGSTYLTPNAGVWQAANFSGVSGMDNFAALPVNSTFDIAFIQHEPGSLCSTPMDKPFSQNLIECQRYYQTSYPWGITKGTATASGSVSIFAVAGTWPQAWIPFSQRMAKSPSLNGYSFATGTLNTVRDTQANTDRSTSGTINSSDNGFSGFQLSSTNGSNAMYIFHYTADTGW